MCGGLQNSNEGQGATSVSSSLSPRVALKFCNLRHTSWVRPKDIQTLRECGCHMEPSLPKHESPFLCLRSAPSRAEQSLKRCTSVARRQAAVGKQAPLPLRDLQPDPSEALRYLYLYPHGDPCSRTTMPPWFLPAVQFIVSSRHPGPLHVSLALCRRPSFI